MATTAENPPGYRAHIGDTRPYWRDIILGVNDGLVSILLLVAGVVGGGLSADQVLLTAIAGAVAGSISMGAGEYLATKSQDEVLAAEIELEREHIQRFPQMEIDQLREMFSEMGVAEPDLDAVIEAFTRSDETLLNAMAALEFGVVESERRSPVTAMLMSASLFLAGSATSVVPFILTDDTTLGLWMAAGFTAVGLFLVGYVKARVTNTGRLRAGLENLLIAGLGGWLAWWVGRIVDAVLS